MRYSKEIFSKAYAITAERRTNAETMAQRRRDEVLREIPEIEDIERKMSSVSLMAAKAVLKGANAKEELEKIAELSKKLRDEKANLMMSHGYRADYMEPQYSCPVCQDTTAVEKDGKTLYCQCFLNTLKDVACDEINKISPLSLSTFDTFSLDKYPYDSNQDGVSPYSRMSKILNFCKSYVANFAAEKPSILMRGATGLGKTHLSLAIANELLNKGYYVVYVSAPAIISKLESAHFEYSAREEEELLSTLCECDLLILDDLGTEFMTPFSKSTIYNLFNTRIMKNKPVIINTNMTIAELESTYSQRFVSRIMSSCVKFDFIGNDIRATK